MTILNTIKKFALVFLASLFLVSTTFGAEIHVITPGAFAEALKILVPEYEKQSPNNVMISYGSSMGAARCHSCQIRAW